MKKSTDRTPSKNVNSLRKTRPWHRMVGVLLSVFVIISSVTGILLSLKKDFDVLQPPTQKVPEAPLSDWLPLHTLRQQAIDTLSSATSLPPADLAIDRMDVRPDKGIVKVRFDTGYWEVQVEGVSGKILSVAQRNHTWIEQIHDGSIINDIFKRVSMIGLGIGLLVLTFTGLWLWYGPKLVKRNKLRGRDRG